MHTQRLPAANHVLSLFAALALANIAPGQCPCTATEHEMLAAQNPAASDELGRSIAIDGSVVIAGVPRRDNAGGQDAGSVIVFQTDGEVLTQMQELVASDADAADNLGNAVGIYDDVAVAGAMEDEDLGADSGSAYVFRFNSTTGLWTQEAKLLAGDGNVSDDFGASVAVQGDIAVVGAPSKENGLLGAAGAVYVFHKAGSTWSQSQKLQQNMAAASDYFGRSVAIDGDRIVIGGTNSGTSSPGKVWVFKLNASVWQQEAQLVPSPAPASSDNYGLSVDINGVDLSLDAIVVLLGWPDVGTFMSWLAEANDAEIHEVAEQLAEILGG